MPKQNKTMRITWPMPSIKRLITMNFGSRERIAPSSVTHMPGRVYHLTSAGEVETTAAINDGNHLNSTDALLTLDLTTPLVDGSRNTWDQMVAVLLNKLRVATTSNTTYTAKDVEVYILNAREVVAAYAQLAKAIGAQHVVNTYDAATPVRYQLLATGACDTTTTINSLYGDVAQAINRMNAIARRVSQLLPMAMPLMARTYSMLCAFFKDSPTEKFSAKSYLVPKVHRYGIMDGEMAYQMEYLFLDDSKITATLATGYSAISSPIYMRTIDGAVQVLERLVDSLIQDDQFNRIAGDMIKAFGPKAFMGLPPIQMNQRAPVLYNESMLDEWHNAAMSPMFPSLQLDISGATSPTQNNVLDTSAETTSVVQPVLRCPHAYSHEVGVDALPSPYSGIGAFIPRTSSTGGMAAAADATLSMCLAAPGKRISTKKSTITTDDILSMTRLTPYVREDIYIVNIGANQGTLLNYDIRDCGTEVPCQLFYLQHGGSEFSGETSIDAKLWIPAFPMYQPHTQLIQNNAFASLPNPTFTDLFSPDTLWALSDWDPEIFSREWRSESIGGGNTRARFAKMMDLDNFAIMSETDLVSLHDIAATLALSTPAEVEDQTVYRFPQ